jgi:eukaryotic-like serine/threonine-protein kinase
MSPEQTRVKTSSGPDDGAATVLQPELAAQFGIHPGTLLVNTYRVERLLGGGGMGEVYLARHAGLGTQHAVKVIRPSMARDRQVMDLFYREAKVLRGVRHDAVVSYDGFVRDDQGRDYLVMEYVEGPSLADRLRRGPLSPAEVLALRDRLAAGLAEAHRKGAVHRDIAPDNVILPGDRIEAAKLIDFGVCKLTDPSQQTIIGSSFAGKYRYASPEQLGLFGGAVDARSDIYSLGLILGAAAQGRPLAMGESFEAALRSRQSVPDLSGVPASLRDWLSAMLQPDPAKRPGTLDALVECWPAVASPGSQRPTGHTVGDASGKAGAGSGARRGVLLVAVLAMIVAAAGGLYWLLRPLTLPEPAPSDSRTEPKPQPQSEPEPEPIRGDLRESLRAGRLDDAFALTKTLVGTGRPPPVEDTWALARALRAAGRLDQCFALARELANAGFGPAALMLAEMYDPLHWSKESSPFSRPNAAKARDWYGRAAESGMAEAGERLKALDAEVDGR